MVAAPRESLRRMNEYVAYTGRFTVYSVS